MSKFGATVFAPLNTSVPPESEIRSFTPPPAVVTRVKVVPPSLETDRPEKLLEAAPRESL